MQVAYINKINTLGYLFHNTYYRSSEKNEYICWWECSKTLWDESSILSGP